MDLEEEGELAGNTLVSLASGEYKAGKLGDDSMHHSPSNHDSAPVPLISTAHSPASCVSLVA